MAGAGRELLRALILGQRGGLSRGVRDAFAASGTAHLLAISGLHLGMVWGLAFLLLRRLLAGWEALALRLSAVQLAAGLALVPAGFYVLLAGATTPTLRAFIMTACLVAALWAGRPYRPEGSLALAALLITLLWPAAPLTLSFQMSFVAVAAILLAAVPLARRLRGPGGPWRWLLAWLALSAVVGLAVMPLSMGAFHQLPLLFLPANALLVPLVTLAVLPLTLLGAALALLWPAAGALLWQVALWPAQGALWLVQALASPAWAAPVVSGPGPALTAVIYLAALLLLALKGPWRWSLGGSAALAALVLALVQALPPPADGRLAAWVLDVGQGSAVVLRLPQGQVVVVDGGGWPGSSLDLGRQAVAPLLWRLGWSPLAVVAASHRDHDHTGGLPFVARHFHPGQIWTNGQPGGRGSFGALLVLAREQGLPVRGPGQLPPKWSLGGARFGLHWPPAQGLSGRWKENARSLWLGVGLGKTWLWLPGDAPPAVEKIVAATLPAQGRHALLAPHHGGKGSCSPALLSRLKPQVVVFSAGCGNRFGMPRPGPRARAKAAGARIVSTARWGAVRLVSDGNSWQVSSHLKKPRFCPGF